MLRVKVKVKVCVKKALICFDGEHFERIWEFWKMWRCSCLFCPQIVRTRISWSKMSGSCPIMEFWAPSCCVSWPSGLLVTSQLPNPNHMRFWFWYVFFSWIGKSRQKMQALRWFWWIFMDFHGFSWVFPCLIDSMCRTLTLWALSSEVPGGVVAPTIILGALLGRIYAQLLPSWCLIWWERWWNGQNWLFFDSCSV